MKKLIALILFLFSVCTSANAQVTAVNPCETSAPRQSVKIAITTATTTELVAFTTGNVIYVCEFSLTISQVVTTANTIKFVYGTGTACATGTTDITGAFGTGGVTAGIPISVNGGGFKTAVSNALCATTTIGGSAAFSGVVSYIQQP